MKSSCESEEKSGKSNLLAIFLGSFSILKEWSSVQAPAAEQEEEKEEEEANEEKEEERLVSEASSPISRFGMVEEGEETWECGSVKNWDGFTFYLLFFFPELCLPNEVICFFFSFFFYSGSSWGSTSHTLFMIARLPSKWFLSFSFLSSSPSKWFDFTLIGDLVS